MTPSFARLRKQMRQMPNFRYTARGRPQSRHRRTRRVENFGGRFAIAIFDLLAMQYSCGSYAARIGMPSRRNSSRASSSFSALVTTVTFMPWVLVYLSGFNSGNTSCSVRPRL